MITEDYVSFETAKLLKEKGFKELTYACFTVDGDDLYNYSAVSNDIIPPTLQKAMKWLRENHKIQIVVSPYNTLNKTWSYYIFKDFEPLTQRFYVFETYEEACEAAIKYCLEYLI